MKNRLIISSDAKNEADDQFAIVHALLSPSVDVVGIVPAHFGEKRSSTSMLDSRAEVDLLLDLLGMSGGVDVANGAAAAMSDTASPIESDGASLIIRECRKPGTVYIIVLGPLTDVASALLLEPHIADNPDVTVVWVGGDPYDEVHAVGLGYEYNLSNDIHAANVVLQSGIRVQQIPWTVYSMVGVGHAELDARVAPYGAIGEYLVRQVKEYNADSDTPREVRSLGDSPALGVVIHPGGIRWRHHLVRHFEAPGRMTNRAVEGRTVAVADSVDVRFLLEDMFAKIKAHHEGLQPQE
jgi:purine nucleosidase